MTTDRAAGYFEAFINSQSAQPTAADRSLMSEVTAIVRDVIPGGQVHWAGSQRKRTAIVGSDLDLCVSTTTPVTESQRRALRAALEERLARPARVLSHAIRLPAAAGRPKVDIAFANAAFGSRPLPDASEFHGRPSRQGAARALKLWTRGGGLPPLPGWAVEALVVHLDQPPGVYGSLTMFLRIVDWLEQKASPAAVEAVLRPAAFPRWNPDWSRRLNGDIEALRNHARLLRRRKPRPEEWTSADDVEAWLCPVKNSGATSAG